MKPIQEDSLELSCTPATTNIHSAGSLKMPNPIRMIRSWNVGRKSLRVSIRANCLCLEINFQRLLASLLDSTNISKMIMWQDFQISFTASTDLETLAPERSAFQGTISGPLLELGRHRWPTVHEIFRKT
jgi:hypothetical protein